MAVEKRVCTGCGHPKPLTREFFNPDRRSSRGFRRTCKTCLNERRRRWAGSRTRYTSQPVLERELAEAPLTAAIEVIRRNPALIGRVAGLDPILYRSVLSEVRAGVLDRMRARHDAQSEIYFKGRPLDAARPRS